MYTVHSSVWESWPLYSPELNRDCHVYVEWNVRGHSQEPSKSEDDLPNTKR